MARALPLLVMLAGLPGCSDSEDTPLAANRPDSQIPVEDMYNRGVDALSAKRYGTAVAQFDAVEQNYPYSSWAVNAQLMHGYAEYLRNHYTDAISTLDRFIQLHPAHRDIAYAYYLRALSFYEQIADIQRDQKGTQEAMAALQEVVNRFPDSGYGRDARLKIDLCRDHLAGKEMSIGRWYEHQHLYTAAINRFQRVVDDFQTTNHTPEALHRLTEIYLKLGLIDQARKTASVLGYNYPGSEWYTDSYRLLADSDNLTRKPSDPAKEQTSAPSSVSKKTEKAPQADAEPDDDAEEDADSAKKSSFFDFHWLTGGSSTPVEAHEKAALPAVPASSPAAEVPSSTPQPSDQKTDTAPHTNPHGGFFSFDWLTGASSSPAEPQATAPAALAAKAEAPAMAQPIAAPTPAPASKADPTSKGSFFDFDWFSGTSTPDAPPKTTPAQAAPKAQAPELAKPAPVAMPTSAPAPKADADAKSGFFDFDWLNSHPTPAQAPAVSNAAPTPVAAPQPPAQKRSESDGNFFDRLF